MGCDKCEINSWVLGLASIPFVTFIILLSCLVAYTPSIEVRDKYNELQPALLTNISKVNCNPSNCDASCDYQYDFVLVKSKNKCVSNGNESDYQYNQIYYMYEFNTNGTNYCDSTIYNEYMLWFNLIISTCVFAFVTFSMIVTSIIVGVCGNRCYHCCKKIDMVKYDRLIDPHKTSRV